MRYARWGGLVALLFLLAACQVGPQQATPPANAPIVDSPYLDALADYVPLAEATQEPTEEAVPDAAEADGTIPAADEKQYVVVATQGARANMRSAPDLDAEIIGKGNPGTVFEVIEQSDEGDWYNVCCVAPLDNPDGEPVEAWVAAQVVEPSDGEGFTVPVAGAAAEGGEPLLPADAEATWSVDWTCGSDRCTLNACSATVTARADSTNLQFLQVAHEVVWDDACFATDSWIFEVDPMTGDERTGDFAENFLYGYWLGADSGEANAVYRYDDELGVMVVCADDQEVEIDEGDGWTTVYSGATCHDIKTGMLVLLTYTKRWLYSGEYDGQTYSRAYFGDSETLEQRLVDTNIDLSFAEPR
ncbi:MAG: SH3 domain-containing protein [Caldilineaceae bacterium]|nr:SH3 domain-containing protein [Caldilineaceae bacterium]